jgi:drug/metabolite transporter (DMT)-like permease
MGRHYRRRSAASSIVRDTVATANVLPWWGAASLGLMLFILFYWILPMWMQSKLDDLQGNIFKPMIEAVFGRRMHWSQWLGIALGLIGLFFAVRNYFIVRSMDKGDLWGVGWLARLVARFID